MQMSPKNWNWTNSESTFKLEYLLLLRVIYIYLISYRIYLHLYTLSCAVVLCRFCVGLFCLLMLFIHNSHSFSFLFIFHPDSILLDYNFNKLEDIWFTSASNLTMVTIELLLQLPELLSIGKIFKFYINFLKPFNILSLFFPI